MLAKLGDCVTLHEARIGTDDRDDAGFFDGANRNDVEGERRRVNRLGGRGLNATAGDNRFDDFMSGIPISLCKRSLV